MTSTRAPRWYSRPRTAGDALARLGHVSGHALAELRRQNIPYYVATKTFATKEAEIRTEIEGQLERMKIDAIDFYHIWCITNLDNWRQRKEDGILDTFRKLKEEGLIRHICVSSHLIGEEIKELLMEGVFEGVLFGYSAYNFSTRQKAFDAIREHNLGAVVMNPLGGGVIPRNPDLFSFIKSRDDETVVEAAIRFLLAHPEISVTLVGFGNTDEVNQALVIILGSSDKVALKGWFLGLEQDVISDEA